MVITDEPEARKTLAEMAKLQVPLLKTSATHNIAELVRLGFPGKFCERWQEAVNKGDNRVYLDCLAEAYGYLS